MSKRLLLVIQLVFFVAIVVFGIQRFQVLTDSVTPSLILRKPIHLSLSVACFLGFYALLACHWQLLTQKFVGKHHTRQWLAFFASQPYKYLPTSLFTFSARATYAKKLGLSVKASSVAQIIENANIVLAGILVVSLFLIFQTSILWGLIGTSLIALIICTVVLSPRLMISRNNFQLSGREWIKLFILPIGAWLFAGLSFYILLAATGHNITVLSAIVANTLAITLGILAVFAPAGIGVREFVYAQFAVAATGIIFWRLLTLVVDFAVGCIAIYLIRRHKGSTKNNTVGVVKA